MYDSPEAAQKRTLTGWVGGGRFFGEDERGARWSGCTHQVCECGKPMSKSYTKCENCRNKAAKERYLALPYKEWDGIVPVTEWDGDKYFFNLEDIQDYMKDNELEDINLLFCDPISYSHIDYESLTGSEAHEDWEPEQKLIDAVKAFNKVIDELPPHSWMPGKIRTSYSYDLDTTD